MRALPILVLTLAAVACGSRSRSPEKLVGEIHVHGFPGGVHPAALFLAAGVNSNAVDGDSIVAPSAPLREGSCSSSSSSDVIAPPGPSAVDAGALRILGGRGIGRVDLAFQ